MKVHDAELALENATLLDKLAVAEARAEAAEKALASAKLRTHGCREVCEHHSIWQNDPNSACTNAAMAGYECRIPNCPVMRGRTPRAEG